MKQPGHRPSTRSKTTRSQAEATEKDINSLGYTALLIMTATACLIGMAVYFLQSL